MVAMVNKRNVQELILLHEATFREIRIQFIVNRKSIKFGAY